MTISAAIVVVARIALAVLAVLIVSAVEVAVPFPARVVMVEEGVPFCSSQDCEGWVGLLPRHLLLLLLPTPHHPFHPLPSKKAARLLQTLQRMTPLLNLP